MGMNQDLPWALIIGIEHFAAKVLAKELSSKDINVVGVGEYVGGLDEIKNFSYSSNLDEIENGSFNYVFDFKGEIEEWNEKVNKSEKVTLIRINKDQTSQKIINKLKELDLDWRIVEAFGVYGPEMEEDEDNIGVGFLVRALKETVSNKNLTLPPVDKELRLLSVPDLVEAVLRASFLSGTNEEIFLATGNVINSEKIAETLINEGKMTRFKVISKEMDLINWDERKIEDTQQRLRWSPEVKFEDGIKETLQYFFMKLDEESRKKPNIKIEKKEEKIIKEKKQFFEVVPVGEETEESQVEVVEEIEEIEEEPEEIKGEEAMEVKNEWPEFVKKNSGFKTWNFNEKEIDLKKEDVVEEEMDKVEDKEEKIIIASPPVLEVKKKKKININWKFNKKILLVGLAILLIIFLWVPVNWGLRTRSAVKSISKAQELIKNKNYEQATKLINKQSKAIKGLDEEVDDLGLNKITFVRNIQSGFKTIEETLDLERSLIPLAQSSETISDAIFLDKEINWTKEIKTVETNINEVAAKMGIVQARLTGDWSWLPATYRSSLQKKTAELSQAKKYLDLGVKSIKLIPELIGTEGKKKEYLVLFQNENEIRPGGGFIGSYGILSFEKGKLINLDIKDIYDSDGQLQGHVEPPEEIKKYLGEAGWFMRDANWNANFPDTAIDLQWFLEKETGRKVDGVIGVNLAVAKAIIGATGEIFIPDFNETINKDNLYEQAEFYAETKFFPGSKQKASFLGALGKHLFEKIRNLKPDQKLELILALLDSLEKNDTQLALNQQEAAKVTADLGWNGAMYQGKCSAENCLSDFLYIVEANLGVNKANYFLYRNVEEQIEITNSSLNRIVKINYENTAKNTNWPGGNYKNYVRIYLPKNIRLTEVSIMTGNDVSTERIYRGDELKVKEVNNKTEVGFLVEVPVTKKKTVIIEYTSDINLGNKFSYVNYIQRQSGFGDTGFVTLISFPRDLQPVQVQPNASLVGGKLLFNNRLDKDLKLGVELVK
jgi:hypothetical protein